MPGGRNRREPNGRFVGRTEEALRRDPTSRAASVGSRKASVRPTKSSFHQHGPFAVAERNGSHHRPQTSVRTQDPVVTVELVGRGGGVGGGADALAERVA